MKRDEVEQLLNECIGELLKRDLCLLENDVSERAITHKLAEYLQDRIPDLNVDCEYNRDATKGEQAPKKIKILKIERENQISSGLEEDDLLAISTYPDIIAHRRMTNDENLLVVEVKKRNSKVGRDHDYRKLRAFTENSEHNSYDFSYGVFLLIDTGHKDLEEPELTWFIEGKEA